MLDLTFSIHEPALLFYPHRRKKVHPKGGTADQLSAAAHARSPGISLIAARQQQQQLPLDDSCLGAREQLMINLIPVTYALHV